MFRFAIEIKCACLPKLAGILLWNQELFGIKLKGLSWTWLHNSSLGGETSVRGWEEGEQEQEAKEAKTKGQQRGRGRDGGGRAEGEESQRLERGDGRGEQEEEETKEEKEEPRFAGKYVCCL